MCFCTRPIIEAKLPAISARRDRCRPTPISFTASVGGCSSKYGQSEILSVPWLSGVVRSGPVDRGSPLAGALACTTRGGNGISPGGHSLCAARAHAVRKLILHPAACEEVGHTRFVFKDPESHLHLRHHCNRGHVADLTNPESMDFAGRSGCHSDLQGRQGSARTRSEIRRRISRVPQTNVVLSGFSTCGKCCDQAQHSCYRPT